MVDRSIKPIVWEYSDVDPSNSYLRSSRVYSTVFDIFLKFLKNKDSNSIEQYLKEDTGFEYDVFLAFEKVIFPNNAYSDEFVKVTYKTSFMDNYKYMVSFSSIVDENDILFYYNQIRSNAGHVLDRFFEYYVSLKSINVFPRSNIKDIDPLDDIGINFEDNPEYINGGYDYFSPAVNEFIVSLHNQEDIYDGSLTPFERFPVITDGFQNAKIKRLLDDWTLMYESTDSSLDILKRKCNTIVNFVNTIIDNNKPGVRFEKFGENFLLREKKNWINMWYSYEISYDLIIYNSDGTVEELIFPLYLFKNKHLRNYIYIGMADEHAMQNIVDIFENCGNEKLKKIMLYSSMRQNYLVDLIIDKNPPIPEHWIDKLQEVISEDNSVFTVYHVNNVAQERMLRNLTIFITSCYKEEICVYSEYLVDIVDFFITNISIEDYFEIKNIDYLYLLIHSIIDTFSDSPNWGDRMVDKANDIELAIQMLYSVKLAWGDKRGVLVETLTEQCNHFSGENISDWNSTDSYSDSTYDVSEYRTRMLVNIICKGENAFPDFVAWHIFDILKFHAKYEIFHTYIKPTQAEIDSGHVSYCGRSTTKHLSYDSINLINVINLLINKMNKDFDNREIFDLTILIVNVLIGGVFIIDTGRKYEQYIKSLNFFLLCSDRYDIDVVKRLLSFVQQGGNFFYARICGGDFTGTIKSTIINNIFPAMWQNKLTVGAFDDLDKMLDPLKEQVFRWGVGYEEIKDVQYNIIKYIQEL